jgi:Fe-S cluster biogenesis protein NfuA
MKFSTMAIMMSTCAYSTQGFTVLNNLNTKSSSRLLLTNLKMSAEEPVISPFDNNDAATTTTNTYNPTEPTERSEDEPPLDLTWDNVDMVLEEMRPYLIQDGGNVSIADIDGPIIRLQLEGACGTCPSSTQTMKMGLERKLRERIPEIQEVIQAMPEGPELTDDEVEVILDGVRPFLKVAGGDIHIDTIAGVGSVQPVITLKMEGTSASLNSVKLEIAQRLQRHFMIAGMQIQWS